MSDNYYIFFLEQKDHLNFQSAEGRRFLKPIVAIKYGLASSINPFKVQIYLLFIPISQYFY